MEEGGGGFFSIFILKIWHTKKLKAAVNGKNYNYKYAVEKFNTTMETHNIAHKVEYNSFSIEALKLLQHTTLLRV